MGLLKKNRRNNKGQSRSHEGVSALNGKTGTDIRYPETKPPAEPIYPPTGRSFGNERPPMDMRIPFTSEESRERSILRKRTLTFDFDDEFGEMYVEVIADTLTRHRVRHRISVSDNYNVTIRLLASDKSKESIEKELQDRLDLTVADW